MSQHESLKAAFLRAVVTTSTLAMLLLGPAKIETGMSGLASIPFGITGAADARVARGGHRGGHFAGGHRGFHGQHHAHRPVARHPVARHPVARPPIAGVIRPIPRARPWYWGRVVAGVTVGTVIAVGVVGAVPPAPSSELCWYWTNSSRTQGYWDYCSPPGM